VLPAGFTGGPASYHVQQEAKQQAIEHAQLPAGPLGQGSGSGFWDFSGVVTRVRYPGAWPYKRIAAVGERRVGSTRGVVHALLDPTLFEAS